MEILVLRLNLHRIAQLILIDGLHLLCFLLSLNNILIYLYRSDMLLWKVGNVQYESDYLFLAVFIIFEQIGQHIPWFKTLQESFKQLNILWTQILKSGNEYIQLFALYLQINLVVFLSNSAFLVGSIIFRFIEYILKKTHFTNDIEWCLDAIQVWDISCL